MLQLHGTKKITITTDFKNIALTLDAIFKTMITNSKQYNHPLQVTKPQGHPSTTSGDKNIRQSTYNHEPLEGT